MSVECQVNVKSQSELDIGGRETCMQYGGDNSGDNVNAGCWCSPVFGPPLSSNSDLVTANNKTSSILTARLIRVRLSLMRLHMHRHHNHNILQIPAAT